MAISKATIKRIQNRVKEFYEARKLIEIRIDEYIAEHERYKGEYKNISVTDMQDYLQHVFVPNEEDEEENRIHNIETKKIPKFTQFIWIEDKKGKKPFWQKNEIAIVIGKVRQTSSDFMGKMEKSNVWREKLKKCRVPREKKTPPYNYSKEVFNVVMDFYEEGAMKTYFKPPNRKPRTKDERDEIKRIWEEIKKSL